MRVGTGLHQGLGAGTKTGPDPLKKKELVEDIFNNRAPTKGDQKGFKLRLSYASQALDHTLKLEIKNVLKRNPALETAIDKIPLEEDTENLPIENQRLRKIKAFFRWQKLFQEDAVGGDRFFSNLVQEDKEGALAKIGEKLDSKKEFFSQEKRKSSSNYYYWVYPETYSFN